MQARLERLRDLRHRRPRSSARSSRTRSTRRRRSSKRPARRWIDEARPVRPVAVAAAIVASPQPSLRRRATPTSRSRSSCRSRRARPRISRRACSARKLAEAWGQGVVIENQAGAAGNIGAADRGQGGAGRLHARDARHQSRHQPEPVQGHAATTSRATSSRSCAWRSRRSRSSPIRNSRRTRSRSSIAAGEGQAERDQLRLGRQRQRHASFARASEGAGRHPDDARAVQEHRADDERHPRQPDSARARRRWRARWATRRRGRSRSSR